MDKANKKSKMAYSDAFLNDIKTGPQIIKIQKFVDTYDLKDKTLAIMEKSRIRQNIANAKSEYDRIKGELSSGQGFAGDTVEMLKARERELSALIRKSLQKH